jgi:tight adherence protein C
VAFTGSHAGFGNRIVISSAGKDAQARNREIPLERIRENVMYAWLLLSLIFLGVATCVFAFYLWLLERRQRAYLASLQSSEPGSAESAEMVLGSFTPFLAGQLPIGEQQMPRLRHDLLRAGFYHPTALIEFQAVRAVLVLLPALATGTLALLARREEIPQIAGFGVFLTLIGFVLPGLYVRYRIRQRELDITRGLPIAIDLLTLSLTGGQQVGSALVGVSHELRESYPVLSDELDIVREQTKLGSLSHALQQFAERTDIADVRNLSIVLGQTNRLGTDVAGTLLEFSNHLRTTLKQRAEVQANQVNYWILFPTILCLWIPATILLLGPVYHEFWARRGETREKFNLTQEEMRKISTQPGKRPLAEGEAPAPPPDVRQRPTDGKGMPLMPELTNRLNNAALPKAGQ